MSRNATPPAARHPATGVRRPVYTTGPSRAGNADMSKRPGCVWVSLPHNCRRESLRAPYRSQGAPGHQKLQSRSPQHVTEATSHRRLLTAPHAASDPADPYRPQARPSLKTYAAIIRAAYCPLVQHKRPDRAGSSRYLCLAATGSVTRDQCGNGLTAVRRGFAGRNRRTGPPPAPAD